MLNYEELIENAVREAGYPERRERLLLHRMICTRLRVQLIAQGMSDAQVDRTLTAHDKTFEQLDEAFQNRRDFGRYAGFQNPWPDQEEDADEAPSKQELVVKRIGRSVWQLVVLLVLIAALGVILTR